jgi:hypothetical protein
VSGPWLWLPLAGPIRISTVVAAIVIVAIVLWRRRGPLLGLVTVMAWASFFEIAFNATGTVLHGWPVAYLAWLAAALGGWLLLATLLGVVPDGRWLAAVAAVWLIWMFTGFDSNAPSGPGPGHPAVFSVADEVLNELAKSLLALAYLTGALQRPAATAGPLGRVGFTLRSRWAWMSRVMGSPSTSERSRG